MILLSENILRTIVIVLFGSLTCVHETATYPSDWMPPEVVAERYPYIVGLLNNHKQYVCTGVSINNGTVLTSGDCVEPQPHFIAAASAVIRDGTASHNLIRVVSSVQHSDYTFNMNSKDPTGVTVHSNIGLVFAGPPVLGSVLEVANVSDYFAPELNDTRLTVVGYIKLRTGAVVLRTQDYHQVPCMNPKWYYCVCGIEYPSDQYGSDERFERGAPVLLESQVVGVVAVPYDALQLPEVAVKYNVFTLFGPYMQWITKNQRPLAARYQAVSYDANSNSKHKEEPFLIKYIVILFLKSNLIK